MSGCVCVCVRFAGGVPGRITFTALWPWQPFCVRDTLLNHHAKEQTGGLRVLSCGSKRHPLVQSLLNQATYWGGGLVGSRHKSHGVGA